MQKYICALTQVVEEVKRKYDANFVEDGDKLEKIAEKGFQFSSPTEEQQLFHSFSGKCAVDDEGSSHAYASETGRMPSTLLRGAVTTGEHTEFTPSSSSSPTGSSNASVVALATPDDGYDTAIDPELMLKYARDPQYGDAVVKICVAKITNPTNLAAKHFSIKYFDALPDNLKSDFIKVVNSGAQNPDSGMGAYAMQPVDYDRFGPFFSRVIADYHKVPLNTQHISSWDLKGVEGLPPSGVLNIKDLGLPELSMRVRVGRNLADFPLPGAMTAVDRLRMEERMCLAFSKLQETYGGRYYSLTPGHRFGIDADQYRALVKAHFMFKDMGDDPYLASAGIASAWPVGRGCYISEDKQFIVWVGEEDHLRIMCMKKGAVLNEVFDRLKNALDTVESIEGLTFAKSDNYGYVTSCPTNLGTGMRASVHVKVPNLTKDGTDAKAKAVCKPLGLSVRGLGGEHTPIGADGTIDLSPSARFAIKESEIITALYKGIKQLMEKERKA